jgi:predicted ATPase
MRRAFFPSKCFASTSSTMSRPRHISNRLTDVDDAREMSREAPALSHRLRNPLALAWAGFFTAVLHVFLREPREALAETDPLIALCTEHQFPLFVGLLTLARGAALSEDGRHEAALVELHKGLAVYRATGQRVSHRLYLSWLAQACARAGEFEEATEVVDEGLAMATDERLFEPELHRIRAELLVVQGGDPARVDESFHEAIALARRLGARSLELRAATGYARWVRDPRRADEAMRHLGEVCAWFPAGLDTRDLHEARAVLEKASASPHHD